MVQLHAEPPRCRLPAAAGSAAATRLSTVDKIRRDFRFSCSHFSPKKEKNSLSSLSFFFFRFQLVQFGQSAGRGPLEEGLEVFLALPALALRPLRRVGGREEHLQPAPPAATFPLLVREEQGRRGGRGQGAEDDDEGRARSPFGVAAARRLGLGLGLGLFSLPDALAESFVAPRLARLDIPLTCPPGAQYGPVGGPR